MPRGSEELTNARKEEIFLALLKREHDAWIADIEEMMCQNTSIDAEAFAETMPGEEIYQCAHCGDVYGRAIAPEVQEENNELWIPIVIIVEGAVILLSVVTGIVLVCIKKRGANKCNGGKLS